MAAVAAPDGDEGCELHPLNGAGLFGSTKDFAYLGF